MLLPCWFSIRDVFTNRVPSQASGKLEGHIDRRMLVYGIASIALTLPLANAAKAEGVQGLQQAANETQKKYKLKTAGGGTYKVAAGEQFNVCPSKKRCLPATVS